MATAHKLPSGSWRVLAYVGMQDGKRRYKSFTGTTKKQAEYQATLYGVRKRRDSAGVTVGEAIDRYIASKSSVLSPKTVKEYRGIRSRAFDGIARLRVDQLTDEEIQREINTLSRSLSPKTVRNAWALLNSSVRMFQPDFHAAISLPQQVRPQLQVPRDQAVKALLDQSTGPLHTAILLSAALGLRRSEICALEWRDITGNSLRVCRAMVIGPDRKWIAKTTKTASSTRVLELPGVVINHLAALPKDQRPVPVTPDGITYRFIQLRDSLGLSVRFHDLRHHFASTLLELGVPDLYAMRRMGHATPNMLKAVYQHLKDEKEAAVDSAIRSKMDALYQ